MSAAGSNDSIRIDLDRLSAEVTDVTRAVDRLVLLEDERSRRFDQMILRQELIDQRVADQQASIAENSARITENNSRMTEYNARMGEIDQRVAESLTQIAEGNARMAEHSAQITANNGRIAENSARMAEIDDRIAASNARIAENTAIIIEQGKRLDAMIVELRQQGEEFRMEMSAMREEFRNGFLGQQNDLTRLNTTLRNAAWFVGIGVPAAIGLTALLVELL